MYAKIILKPGKEESLKRFHPWVFSGAIAKVERTSVRSKIGERSELEKIGERSEPIEEGDKALVVSATGEVLGVGHTQVGSIAVRMLSFQDEIIDSRFYENRLQQALNLRQSLNLLRTGRKKDEIANNAFRLVHGEGDFLPGLVIDVYGDTAVVQAHSVGMHLDREWIAEALLKVGGKFIKNVYYKSEGTLPYKAELPDLKDGYLKVERTSVRSKAGERSEPEKQRSAKTAIENGIKFHPDWEQGQKTGFFVDQRENRALVEHYAADRRVLNMFCYTGGFSLYALRGGAKLVHSVDASAKAMELTDRNVALNFGNEPRHKSFTADAFEFLREMEDGAYDLMILDPPAFAKHQKVLNQALQGYRKLNALGFRKIAPGGILFTFSCSQAVSKDDFRKAVFTAAAQSGRKVRILHQLTQPADHPINIYHPEGEYLKGLVLYVE